MEKLLLLLKQPTLPIVVEALKRKGYTFESNTQMCDFITEHCSSTVKGDCTTFYLFEHLPFLQCTPVDPKLFWQKYSVVTKECSVFEFV